MDGDQNSYRFVSPILIIGIIVFAAPYFNYITHFGLPKGLFNILGIILILAGGAHSIMKASD